jgi:predicted phage gp36 major capsid-like protein
MAANMKATLILAALASALVEPLSAAAQPTPAPTQMVWARTDGRLIQDNPRLVRRAKSARAICKGARASAAASMGQLHYHSHYGVINSGAAEQQRQNMLESLVNNCMAKRGYIYVTSQEAEARRVAAAKDRRK